MNALSTLTISNRSAGVAQVTMSRPAVFNAFDEAGPITSEVRELTARTISRVRGTAEAQEGFAAFLAKRPANWIPS